MHIYIYIICMYIYIYIHIIFTTASPPAPGPYFMLMGSWLVYGKDKQSGAEKLNFPFCLKACWLQQKSARGKPETP